MEGRLVGTRDADTVGMLEEIDGAADGLDEGRLSGCREGCVNG